MFRSMLATDVVLEKLKFPVCVLPKIDGVRGVVKHGKLTGRSMKQFKNKYVTELFSKPEFEGFDGELTVGDITAPDLCRKTTSAVNTILGEPNVRMQVFDTTRNTILGYEQRHDILEHYIAHLRSVQVVPISIVEMRVVTTLDELLTLESSYLADGYEGIIIRKPNYHYKQGRSTVAEGGFLRLKRFLDGEMLITKILEGETNNNEVTTNALGYTERSTHQANMIGNGMVGTIIGTDLKTGEEVTIAPGKMLHRDRFYFFQNPENLIGKIARYKHFPKGVKDKLRFATFQGFRIPEDM